MSIWDISWEVIFEWQGERRRGTFAHHSKWRVCSQAWIKPSFTVYSVILFRGHLGTGMHFASKLECAVADPDRHIRGRGWGGWSSTPWDNGGPGLQNSLLSALRASVWSKNKGGPPSGPLPWIRDWCGKVEGVGLGEEPGPLWPCFIFSGNCPPPPLTPFDLIAVYSHLCIPLLSKSKMAATVLVSKLARS